MEKRLSYFDLAENDYQFLLKDRKEGRIGNLMCSAAQNICERYLKHMIDISVSEVDTTRILQTHSLKALRRFMQEYVPEFKGDWRTILQADGYYFSARYPGDTAFLVGKEDVDDCWEAVEESRSATLIFLKEREYGKTPVDQEEPEMIQEKDFSCEPLKPEKKKSRSR